MKKALLAAIVLVASCLVSIGFTSSPAAAACYPIPTGKSSTFFTDFGTSANFRVQSTVAFKPCDSGVQIWGYSVRISRVNGSCESIDYFRVNPDIIGDWNPGTKTADCQGAAERTISWSPSGTYKAYAGDSAANRCIGGTVDAVQNNWPDGENDLPSLCVI